MTAKEARIVETHLKSCGIDCIAQPSAEHEKHGILILGFMPSDQLQMIEQLLKRPFQIHAIRHTSFSKLKLI